MLVFGVAPNRLLDLSRTSGATVQRGVAALPPPPGR
jgi:hypothetical protein